jgi:hypothetical protein
MHHALLDRWDELAHQSLNNGCVRPYYLNTKTRLSPSFVAHQLSFSPEPVIDLLHSDWPVRLHRGREWLQVVRPATHPRCEACSFRTRSMEHN